jgi:ubiquinone/menaquinone biosynthesis C-methylase UbiE
LRSPRGVPGRLLGNLMCLINHAPNAMAIAALGVGKHDHVLEVGFGPGCALRQLARIARLGHVSGIDPSPVMLDQASSRNREAIRAGAMELHVARHDGLPLPDGSIDRILAVNVAYFFNESSGQLADMWRVLKPGGRLVIYVTAETSMRNWKFASTKSHRLFDTQSLGELLACERLKDSMSRIESIRLPLGINGLLAVIDKLRPAIEP